VTPDPEATSGSPPLRVMIVEDHTLVRAAIRRTLSVPGMQVVAEASSAEEALEKVIEHRPDVILVDIELPGMNGVQLVRELAPRLPNSHIVMLTGSANRDDLVAAIRGGASGYLTKDMSPEGLVRAVFGVRDGDLPMPRRLARQLVSDLVASPGRHSGEAGLSQREMEVLKLVADGLTDREIGDSLGISPRTVGRHVGSLLDKLEVRNRAEAARRYRDGL
jgi:DNA-binding NarL/FixJ family response regulator